MLNYEYFLRVPVLHILLEAQRTKFMIAFDCRKYKIFFTILVSLSYLYSQVQVEFTSFSLCIYFKEKLK